jgi:hypothetical protein
MIHSSRGRRNVIALALLSLSCATPNGGGHWVRTELYFGTQRADRSAVSEAEWQSFLGEVITPRFATGLTVLEGTGQWRGQQGLVHERTHVLILIHPPTRESSHAIEEICGIYRTRFGQDSVLRVTQRADVDF